MDAPAVSSPFTAFAVVAEAVRGTTKRLEKAAFLGEYFAGLSDSDLVHAARWFAGAIFPQRDQRTINIGGATLFAAIHLVSGADEDLIAQRSVELGDLGDVAGEVFAASHDTQPDTALTLDDVADAFEILAATSGSRNKLEQVEALLRRADAHEAKYLVKLLSGDLRIGLREGAVEDGIARLADVKVGQVQWTNMLTGDIGETALLARRSELGSARMRLFHPLKFMLATPAADLADIARQMTEAFYVEDKFDGIRAQAHISCRPDEAEAVGEAAADDAPPKLHGIVNGGCRVALFSRTLDEITQAFPDLVAPLAALLGPDSESDGLMLDGEIVPVEGEKILPFQELQKRLGRKTPSDEILARIPVAFVAYDILYAESRVVLDEPFETRRALLEALPMAAAQSEGAVRRAESKLFNDVPPLDDEFDAARERGNEGLMVKAPASTYKPGRRGRDWLKVKRALATLDVVVTSVEVGSGRRSRFLSDYTFAVRAAEDDPALLNIGKAYSGLTDAELEEMSVWFKAHTLQQFAHGRVRVVEPQIVIEIAFDRVQASPRHKSGYALRFPRIVRLRPDKPVDQIDTLETVRRLAGE